MVQNQVWNASHYDSKLAYVTKYGEDVLTLLEVKPNEKIIDLGCGSGHLTHQIAECGAKVIGIDYSQEMIKKAKTSYPNLTFIVANAENFNVPEQVDAVFSNAALHWMKQADAVANAIYHSLKGGGRFVAEFGGQDNVAIVTQAIEDVLYEHFNFDAKSINPWYFPSIAQYATILEETGFYVKYVEHIDRPTAMVDGDAGLFHWLDGFGSLFFNSLSAPDKQQAYQLIAEKIRPKLYRNGTWYIDYKRIRVIAIKQT